MLAAGAPFIGASVRAQSRGESIVTTASGQWRGHRDGALHIFKGLRYGADTAQRRFLPPVAPALLARTRRQRVGELRRSDRRVGLHARSAWR